MDVMLSMTLYFCLLTDLAQALLLPNLTRGIEPMCAGTPIPAGAGNCDHAFDQLQDQRTMVAPNIWGGQDVRILLAHEAGCKIWVQRAPGWTHEEKFRMADYFYRLKQVYQKCIVESREDAGRIPLGRELQVDGYVLVTAEDQALQLAG